MSTKKSSIDPLESRFYSRFNLPPQGGVSFEHTESRTFSSFRDDCDINVIMQRYRDKGILTHLSSAEPLFGDFSTAPDDLADAYEFVRTAQDYFSSLPSSVRDRFDHDPVKFFDFYNDSNNNDELVKMGLKVPNPSPSDSLSPPEEGSLSPSPVEK